MGRGWTELGEEGKGREHGKMMRIKRWGGERGGSMVVME